MSTWPADPLQHSSYVALDKLHGNLRSCGMSPSTPLKGRLKDERGTYSQTHELSCVDARDNWESSSEAHPMSHSPKAQPDLRGQQTATLLEEQADASGRCDQGWAFRRLEKWPSSMVTEVLRVRPISDLFQANLLQTVRWASLRLHIVPGFGKAIQTGTVQQK